jgi:hypothetical protein
MSFTGIPFLSSLLLFAAGAAALAALHMLRSHPQRLRVVTTLFWHEVRSAARPRTLWHRFRYLATFLLLATIIGLMAFSLSRPIWRLSATPARHVVIVLDAGMSMRAPGRAGTERRFELARRAAAQQVESLGPRDRLAIIVVDPLPRVVHAFDQPIAAARRELQPLQPANEPADTDAAIRLARSLLAGRRQPVVVWITDRTPTTQPAASGFAGSTPPLIPIRVGDGVANAAILSALFVPDQDDPTRGRVRVRVGWWGKSGERIGVRVEATRSSRVLFEDRLRIDPGDSADAVSDPVPANGQKIRATLTEPQGIEADNELEFRLPNRPPIVVAADESLPTALRLALAASPARLVKPNDPTAGVSAFISRAGRPTSGKPAVVLMDSGPPIERGSVVQVAAATPATDGLDLERAVCDAGRAIPRPDHPGGFAALLQAGEAVLAALDVSDPKAGRLLLSQALFGRGSTAPNHPAFAILLSRAVRQLGGWDPLPCSLPAGRAVVDPVWLYRASASTGPGLIVAPGDRDGSDLNRDTDSASARPQTGLATTAAYAISQLMLLLVLVLLLVETALHARGRVV